MRNEPLFIFSGYRGDHPSRCLHSRPAHQHHQGSIQGRCTMSQPLWWLTKDGDRSCLKLYSHHYSARKAYRDGRPRYQFVGPGASIVLRTADASALFVWREYIDDTIPKQNGIECSVFRNEGPERSSELIRQADAIADFCWPGARHYTKVDPPKIRSSNPGFCFLAAGWRKCGLSKGGLQILQLGKAGAQ